RLAGEESVGGPRPTSAPPRLQAVTAEDIQRVAAKYFTPENRAVAIYRTKGGGSAPDPKLAALSEEDQAQIKALKSRLESAKPEDLRQILARMKAQEAGVPEEKKALFQVMVQTVE